MDIERRKGETRVRRWMSRVPVAMFAHVPVHAALGFMELRKSPYLVVVAGGTVIGIVSRNHLQAAAYRGDKATVGTFSKEYTGDYLEKEASPRTRAF